MGSHYDDLGVSRSASADDIKRSYRRKAHKLHPDKGGDAQQFHTATVAYEILSDPNKRRQYDATGEGPIADVEQQMRSELIGLVLRLIDQMPDAEHHDLIGGVRRSLQHSIEQVRAMKRDADGKATKLEAAATRIGRKDGGDNPIAAAIRHHANVQRQLAARHQQQVELQGKLLEMAADYVYEYTAAASATTGGSTIYFSA